MKKKKLLLIALLLVGAASSFAAKVDTLLVKSPSMNKDIKVVVVTPDAALGKKATACPTVYLLHGFGGHAKTWIEIKPWQRRLRGTIIGNILASSVIRLLRHLLPNFNLREKTKNDWI